MGNTFCKKSTTLSTLSNIAPLYLKHTNYTSINVPFKLPIQFKIRLPVEGTRTSNNPLSYFHPVCFSIITKVDIIIPFTCTDDRIYRGTTTQIQHAITSIIPCKFNQKSAYQILSFIYLHASQWRDLQEFTSSNWTKMTIHISRT